MLPRIASAPLALLFCLVACSKGDHAPAGAPSASSAPAPAPSPSAGAAAQAAGACDVVTCANFMGAPGYVGGHAETLATFPPPPPGASLCGGSTTFGATNYYTTSQSPADVIAYYEKELPSRGFTLKPRKDGPRACSLMLSLHKKPMDIGNVMAFAGGFSVMYGGK